MSYNLVYTHRAEKGIKKLDSSIKRQIGKAILKLRGNPLEYSECPQGIAFRQIYVRRKRLFVRF